ncbi:hypothetical protein EV1_020417 [Malus domestica]
MPSSIKEDLSDCSHQVETTTKEASGISTCDTANKGRRRWCEHPSRWEHRSSTHLLDIPQQIAVESDGESAKVRIDSMWGGKNKQRERRTGPEQEQEVRERTAKHKKKRLPPTLAIAKAGG